MKNWFGSSKAMEARAALDMLVRLYDKFNIIVERIIADDDSSVRSMCAWNNTDYMKNYNVLLD